GGATELQEVLHDPLQAIDLIANYLRVLRLRRTPSQRLQLGEQAGLDRRQRVANLMGHAGGEHTEGSQFLLPFQNGVGFHQLDAKRVDHFAVDQPRQPCAQQQQQEQRAEDQHTQEAQRLARIGDRKSTRLNSSHANISYAVFSLN